MEVGFGLCLVIRREAKGRKKGTKNTPKEKIQGYETASFRAFKSFFIELMRLLSTIMVYKYFQN